MLNDYNDLFTSNKIYFSDDIIEGLSQKYIMNSSINLEEKKSFLRLKKEYYKIRSINDFDIVQQKLYDNKSKAEILTFELSRILKQNDDNPSVLEYISSIQSILSSYKGEVTDDVYINVSNIIIFLELSLGMKIGLFKELNLIFENKLRDIAMMSNDVKKK